MKLAGNRGRAVSCLAVVLLAAGAIGASTQARPDERVSISALFEDASALVPGNEVKAAGVTVGAIDAVDLDGGRALVRMTVERSVLPLHRDATVTITDKDLLGERFIALDRGSPAAPLRDAAEVIPLSHTDRVVDLESILNSVDDPTGTALAALLTTLGEGASGTGPDIAAGIAALEPAMRDADELGRMLSEQNEVLAELVASAQPVAAALAAERGERLDRLVDSAERTMVATAAEREAIRDTLRRLPDTLASARTVLANLAGVADNVAPMLASMRPVTDDLTDISGELERFSDAADPALASLVPVLERGRSLLDESAPVVRALSSASGDMAAVAESSATLTKTALSKRLGNLMEFLRGWSLATSQYDGLSHYFRAAVPLTPKALGHLAAGPVRGAPDDPVPTLPLPRVPMPAPLGSGHDDGHGAEQDDHTGSATGLTEDQENALLGQLIGGR